MFRNRGLSLEELLILDVGAFWDAEEDAFFQGVECER